MHRRLLRLLLVPIALSACGGKSNGASGPSSGGSGSSSGSAGSSSGTTGSSSGTTGSSSGAQDASPSSFGTPTPVAQHILNPPTLLASDGVTLFWIDSQAFLWSEPAGGGTPKQLASSASGFLYLDSTNVYFEGGGGFASIPKQGGTTSTLITTNVGNAASVTAGTVYWVSSQGSGPVVVKSAPLVAGGAVTTLGTLPRPIPPSAIAAAGTTIFLGGPGTGAPGAIPTDGGSSNIFNVGGCFSLVAGTDGAYCGEGTLTFVALDGTTTTTIAAEANDVASIALDATNVYWVNKADSGSIVTAPRNGGANVTVAYDTNPYAVAVDDAAVYWSDAAGNLQRAAKQ